MEGEGKRKVDIRSGVRLSLMFPTSRQRHLNVTVSHGNDSNKESSCNALEKPFKGLFPSFSIR